MREQQDLYRAIRGLIDRTTQGRVRMSNVTTRHADNEALLRSVAGGAIASVQEIAGHFICGISACGSTDICSP
jgi:hypothetical protein